MRELSLFHEHLGRVRVQKLKGSHMSLLRGDVQEAWGQAREAELVTKLAEELKELSESTDDFVVKHLKQEK